MKTMILTLALAISSYAFSADKMGMGNKASQIDDLIRGEMAAVKTYDTALKKVKDPAEMQKLKSIRQDHANAVDKLKSFAVSQDIKEDTESAGVWGAFATAYTGGARLFGNEAALKALRQGEEHGVKEYNEALEDETITPQLKQMIKTEFLPKQQQHINTLKTTM